MRVFHRFGDYEHPQRNRLKFVVRALGWDGFRARFEEALDGVPTEGGARCRSIPPAPRSETAPDWAPAAAADTPGGRRDGEHAGDAVPGIMPGTVRLQPLPDAYRSLDAQQRQQAAAARLLPRDRAACRSATSLRVRCACLPISPRLTATASMRLTVEQNVLFRWVKARIDRAVLPAPRGSRTRGARCQHAERRGELPGRGELPAGRDAVARARPRAHGASQRPSRTGRPGAVRSHQDQRLPERMRTASHRVDRVPGKRSQARSRVPCRSTSSSSAAAAPMREPRTSARSCRRSRFID